MSPYDNLLSNAQKAEMELVRAELERVARSAANTLVGDAQHRQTNLPQFEPLEE